MFYLNNKEFEQVVREKLMQYLEDIANGKEVDPGKLSLEILAYNVDSHTLEEFNDVPTYNDQPIENISTKKSAKEGMLQGFYVVPEICKVGVSSLLEYSNNDLINILVSDYLGIVKPKMLKPISFASDESCQNYLLEQIDNVFGTDSEICKEYDIKQLKFLVNTFMRGNN